MAAATAWLIAVLGDMTLEACTPPAELWLEARLSRCCPLEVVLRRMCPAWLDVLAEETGDKQT